jgi:hypothetical protein
VKIVDVGVEPFPATVVVRLVPAADPFSRVGAQPHLARIAGTARQIYRQPFLGSAPQDRGPVGKQQLSSSTHTSKGSS